MEETTMEEIYAKDPLVTVVVQLPAGAEWELWDMLTELRERCNGRVSYATLKQEMQVEETA